MTESATMRWEQFTEAAELFLRQGSFSQAEDALKGAIDAAREQRGERGDAQLARALARMAWLRSERGDKKGANELLDSALDAAERAGAAGDEALVRALHQPLAHLLAGGTMPSIEPRAERLLAIAERALGDSARGIALPLNTLARACFKRGDLDRAEQLLKRLLAIKRAESAGSIEVAAVHASLGKLFAARRQHDRAEEAWRFALAIREQALSPRDAAVANALLGLADACEAQGKRAQGKTLRERGLAIRETALGPEHARLAGLRSQMPGSAQPPSGSLEHLMYYPPAPTRQRADPPPPRPGRNRRQHHNHRHHRHHCHHGHHPRRQHRHQPLAHHVCGAARGHRSVRGQSPTRHARWHDRRGISHHRRPFRRSWRCPSRHRSRPNADHPHDRRRRRRTRVTTRPTGCLRLFRDARHARGAGRCCS